jgi:hypothetical protein
MRYIRTIFNKLLSPITSKSPVVVRTYVENITNAENARVRAQGAFRIVIRNYSNAVVFLETESGTARIGINPPTLQLANEYIMDGNPLIKRDDDMRLFFADPQGVTVDIEVQYERVIKNPNYANTDS